MRKIPKIPKILLTSVLAAAACGGGQKTGSGLGDGNAPPPPPSGPTAQKDGAAGEGTPVKREVSKEAKNDFQGAEAFFDQTDKANGWNESSCRSAADKFQSVVRSHPDLVEAQYMVGLSFHRCNLMKDAEQAYQSAARGQGPYAAKATSNLGEIYYAAGKVDAAKGYWESALKIDGKLVAARNMLASLMLEDMRKLSFKDAAWKKLDEDARFQLSNVLGVDSENVKAYTVMALIWMEGFQGNKNRLDLAKFALDEAKKRNEKFAPLQNAYGLYYMHRNAQSEALQHFMAAVDADPKFVEARMNVGLTTVNFRKYDTAKEQFSKVLELTGNKNYDAYIGLGLALRGANDFAGAEQQYNNAIKLDGTRGEAYYNLGVLYKDFKANKAASLQDSQKIDRQAKDYFNNFLSKTGSNDDKAEAKEQIILCDKLIAQIDQFLKAQAAAPPPPPPQTPPSTPPAGAGSGSGSGT
jgi:tetratricopeptide (TPR) repeat protein|nr:tetratricopeptide repeat protein [Kofleriaceae bacterium]